MERLQIEELLVGLVRSGGSTLHLIPDQPPLLRIQENLVAAGEAPLSGQVIADLARELLFDENSQRFENGEEVELLHRSAQGVRFRTTVIPQVNGTNMVFRQVPETVPSFKDLELPEILSSFLCFRSGLFLVTGFFGSGKGMTLAAIVDRINRERPVHVVTIEDAIECIHTPATAMIQQREVGTHVETVASGIHQASRLGAEVIAAGEIRTFEDLGAAVQAAERGSLVIATYTASCVVAAIAEILALAPSPRRNRFRYRFTNALRAIVSQTLIRRRHGQGRLPLLEILVKNQVVARAIRRGRLDTLPDLMAQGRGLGMQTTDIALRGMLNRHLITTEEAAFHALDREWVCATRVAPLPGS